MRQQYICDIYINQMKINIPNKVDYIIPDKCIIGDFEKSYDSDEDIIDNEVINIKKNERKILLENKKKELENLEKLKEEIDRLKKDN